MMQHNVTTTQQGQPSVHSQIPVARYVNVISSKTEPIKVSGENIKTLTPQNRQTITVPSARVISASHPINVNIRRKKSSVKTAVIRCDPTTVTVRMKQRKPTDHLPYADYETTGNQQNRSQPIHIITSNQQQQMYQSNNQQHHPPFVDASGDNVFSNGSPSRNFQNYSEGNNSMLYSSNQQQNTNNGLNNYFDSAANVSNQVNVTSSPHQNNLNMSTAGTNNSNHGIGQLISSPGGSTYIIQGSGSESGIVALPLSQATRASPATVSHFRREPKTVHWLMEHFENAEGVSLPRALMYNHYLLHCQEQQLDPVNAASFGKLVRSVFVGLRTRRLGTRGNSKYHYYGIRIKVNSPLNQLQDEIGYIAMRQQPSTHSKNRYKMHDKPQHAEHHPVSQVSITEQVQQQAQQHQQFLGDASQALPDLDPIQFDQKDLPMPDSFTQEDLLILEDLYRDHCANILDVIVNLQFSCMDNLWYTFWRVDVVSDNSQHPTREELEMKLPRQKFIAMCQWPPVQRWIKDSDHMIYQSLVEVLIPDVLRPIPSALTQAIRNFAKGLEASLTTVLNKTEIPKELVRLKIAAVSAFSQTLRRYTSLNHLAQAARAVLNNVAQINQMLSDLNRVDFTNVQEQASWVCQCDDSIVSELETDFKAALSEQRTLEQWADWLEAVVTKVLQPFEGTDKVTRVARQFLLKWCFYSSMVIRDLTLRSAASFGSFHLIRLLYDEYMFYLVEHRVAQATGETTIAVMGDFANIPPKYLSPAELTIPKTELGVTTSSLASPATFIASAPIANVNVTANIKMQEKAPKRTASAALLDAVVTPQIITAASDNLKSEQSSASVVGGNKVSTIGGMITIKTPRTDTT